MQLLDACINDLQLLRTMGRLGKLRSCYLHFHRYRLLLRIYIVNWNSSLLRMIAQPLPEQRLSSFFTHIMAYLPYDSNPSPLIMGTMRPVKPPYQGCRAGSAFQVAPAGARMLASTVSITWCWYCHPD